MGRSRPATKTEVEQYRAATKPHYDRLRALGKGWTAEHQKESEAISQVLRGMNAYLAHGGMRINHPGVKQ